MKTYTIGIDFGTTKTLVAYYDEDAGAPVVAHLGRERNSIPTSVFLSEDGTWLFGEDADDQAYDEQQIDRYATAFKLKLGSPSPALQHFTSSGHQSFTALELTAKFLEHVRILCENEVFNGHKVTGAVITHPAMFGPAQVEDLRAAAQQAGFDKVRLMRDPEAAGLALCELCPQEAFAGAALAADWGGGTLDLALVSRDANGDISVQDRYTTGSDTLGGNFLDEFIWKDARKKLKAKGEDIMQDPAHIQLAQKKRVRLLKERLSKIKSGRLILPGELGPHSALEYSREDLERIIRPEIRKGISEVSQLLKSIKTSSLVPDQVLLIGGSSQIPLVGKLITDNTGIICKRWQYSHEAVALGAALSAEEHGDDDIEAEPSEYYVSVASQQLRTGARLSITIEGVNIQFRVQPHSKEGTEILLPAEETKGLGPLRLILTKQADSEPQAPKLPLFEQASRLIYGAAGCPYDLQQGFDILFQGVQQGDVGCMIDLAGYYDDGVYLPYNPGKARSLLLQAVAAGSKSALATLYAFGMDEQANPLSEDKKEQMCLRVVSDLGHENPVDSDDSRYLNLVGLFLKEFDIQQASDCLNKVKDSWLVPIYREILAYIQVIQGLDDAGISEQEIASCCYTAEASLLNIVQYANPLSVLGYSKLCDLYSADNSPLYNPQKALECAHQGALLGDPGCAVAEYNIVTNYGANNNKDIANTFINRLLSLARYGQYGRPDENAIPGVTLSIETHSVRKMIGIPNVNELPKNNVSWVNKSIDFGPDVVIENTNSILLTNLTLTLRCAAGIFRHHIEQIQAGEKCSLTPGFEELEGWPELASDDELCLSRGNQCCYFKICDALIALSSPDAYPLASGWSTGFFGGRTLQVSNLGDSPVQVTIHKCDNEAVATVSIAPGAVTGVGWSEFSDSKSVTEGELVFFDVEGYAPTLGIITGESDGTAGWKKALKVAGSAALFTLGLGN